MARAKKSNTAKRTAKRSSKRTNNSRTSRSTRSVGRQSLSKVRSPKRGKREGRIQAFLAYLKSAIESRISRDILATIFMAAAVFLTLSLVSHQIVLHLDQSALFSSGTEDGVAVGESFMGSNLMGPIGHFWATLFWGAFGWSAFIFSLVAALTGLRLLFFDRASEEGGLVSLFRLSFGATGFLVAISIFNHCLLGREAGGLLGAWLSEPLKELFGLTGAVLIASALLLVFLSVLLRLSIAELMRSFWFYTKKIGGVIYRGCRRSLALLSGFTLSLKVRLVALLESMKQERVEESKEEVPSSPQIPLLQEEASKKKKSKREKKLQVVQQESKPAKKKRTKLRKTLQLDHESPFRDYELPKLKLLAAASKSTKVTNKAELEALSSEIERKLLDFNIRGRVTYVHPGPVVTMYEFQPAAGVKVGKIVALQDDLSMALKASSIRIIAPIPKRGTVGIEIPNRQREIVRLREVLESEALAVDDSLLSVPLGKDVFGNPLTADIAKMPHLLMAGATGTGKSVCINAILLSMLYRCSPEELGLILIDPKVLELSIYEDIPHLKVPVVTEAKKAKAVLQWAVDEMERRYRLMKRFGVRSIDGYNHVAAGTDTPFDREELEDVIELGEDLIVSEGTVEKADEAQSSPGAKQLQRLSKIVIVIDELADLMLTVGKEIEDLITRLAQKARAAGIHLIVATQRPSVDVITGLIKANFPARLSFRVSSRIDSRTILDTGGAEKLLGNGDMLLFRPGSMHPKRLHGAFVSDQEVQRVVSEVKAKCKPQYDEKILEMCRKAEEDDKSSRSGAADDDEYDPLYDQAVELVVKKGQASTSMVQRAFRIGYNRAARIIECMEQEGVVGPSEGSKPREVLLGSTALNE